MSTLVLHVPWTQDIDFFIKGPSKIYKNYIESQSNLIKVTPANIYVNVKKFYSDIMLVIDGQAAFLDIELFTRVWPFWYSNI